jgi:ribosomal protein S18 acetylase RimI-like enzyme
VKSVEVTSVRGPGLAGALRLLEGSLRAGEPVSEVFVRRLDEAIERGELEVLAARAEGRIVGVAVLAYRLSVSADGLFASIEELHVEPDARRRGVGREMLELVGRSCAARGVSYVEALVEDEQAAAFYAAGGYEEEPGVRVFSRSYVLFDPEP